MRNRKKLTSVLLAVAMLICQLPSAVWADDNKAELPPVMTSYDGTTLGDSNDDTDEGDNGGISVMSLLPPYATIKASITLDRTNGLPADFPNDSRYAFRFSELITEIIKSEKNRKTLLENNVITENNEINGTISYSYDDDKYNNASWDDVISPPGTNLSSVHIYISTSNDTLNTDYILFNLSVYYKFFENGDTINADIDRTGGVPDGFDKDSKDFYVYEALKNYLAEKGMLNAAGDYDGSILYRRSSLYDYAAVSWNDVIGGGYSSYDFVLGGNGLYGGTYHKVNVNLKFNNNDFVKNIKFKPYNQSGAELTVTRTSSYDYTDYKSITNYISEMALGKNEHPRFLVTLPEGYSDSNVQVYEGRIKDEAGLTASENITSKVIGAMPSYEMDVYSSISFNKYLTFVVTEADGSKVFSCVYYQIYVSSNSINLYTNVSGKYSSVYLYDSIENGKSLGYTKVYDVSSFDELTVKARVSYSDSFDSNGTSLSKIDFACLGNYASKEAAVGAGALDIKEQLFVNYTKDGYVVDLSQCIGKTAYSRNGDIIQIKYIYVTVVDIYGNVFNEKEIIGLGHINGTGSDFKVTGVMIETGETDDEGNRVKKSLRNIYAVSGDNDNYYENGYQTIFILDDDRNAIPNGTTIYPVFTSSEGSRINVDVTGGLQTSEQSPITFESGKAIQYNVKSEDGKSTSDYWVTFVTQQEGAKLFVNATNFPGHYSESGNPQREIFIKSKTEGHDILYTNIGKERLENISVKLSDNTHGVMIDDYWTVLEGGVEAIDGYTGGMAPKVSKIRLIPIDESMFSVISGMLTFTSAGNDSVNIELTGIAGEPKIVTETLFEGVKYVPYSCAIMTNSMYDTDIFKFSKISGRLPEGIELKEDGELSGIPMEYGSFSFRVQAKYVSTLTGNEYTAEKSYTLVIKNNTDENVDAVNEDGQGHALREKISREITIYYKSENNGIPVIDHIEADSNLFWSEGEFSDFIDFFLDGKTLDKSKYTAESGSTKITVNDQTFSGITMGNKDERHTLAAKFETGETKDLKRSAQNISLKYVPVKEENNDGDKDNNNGNENNGNENNGDNTQGSNTGNNQGGNPGGSRPSVPVSVGGQGTASSYVDTGSVSNQSTTKTEKGSATISMTITDKRGNPLSDLQIELHSTPKYASTDSSGQTAFSSVEFGKHTLYITDPATGRKRSKSFTLTSGSAVEISGSAITAVNGGTVSMTVTFDGKNISFTDSQGEDVSSGAYFFDIPDNSTTSSQMPFIGTMFALTAAVVTILRRKIQK